MSDMDPMDREMKKRQLRRNIVQLPREEEPARYEEEDSEEIIRQVQTSRRRKRLLISLFLILFLAATGFCWYKYQNEYEYTEYSVVWERAMRYIDENSGQTGSESGEPENEGSAMKNIRESSFVKYEPFGENAIRYTKDGASYIDGSGKTIWTQSYQMKTPVINTNGEYAVIADQQGNDIYICSTEGCTGVAKTQLPITKAAVSAKGVTAAVVEDSTACYVFYFRKNGAELGINIKMLLSGDGYPLDIALSPDGKQIVMSVMYLKNGALKNKVVFYDFSEIGKNVNNRFIGAFEEEFDDKLAARVRYLNQDTVAAFTDKGITFISVKNVIPDTNVISVPVEEEIKSICWSDKYAGVVVENPSGNPSRLDVYTPEGKRVSSVDFDYNYTGVEIDGDRLILYNEDSCRVYNMDGHKKFEGQFESSVSFVRAGKKHMNSLIVAGSEQMREIRLR